MVSSDPYQQTVLARCILATGIAIPDAAGAPIGSSSPVTSKALAITDSHTAKMKLVVAFLIVAAVSAVTITIDNHADSGCSGPVKTRLKATGKCTKSG